MLSLARLNTARIPSMAEDVTTDLMTMLLRATGSRRKGFADESFVPMGRYYQRRQIGDWPRRLIRLEPQEPASAVTESPVSSTS